MQVGLCFKYIGVYYNKQLINELDGSPDVRDLTTELSKYAIDVPRDLSLDESLDYQEDLDIIVKDNIQEINARLEPQFYLFIDEILVANVSNGRAEIRDTPINRKDAERMLVEYVKVICNNLGMSVYDINDTIFMYVISVIPKLEPISLILNNKWYKSGKELQKDLNTIHNTFKSDDFGDLEINITGIDVSDKDTYDMLKEKLNDIEPLSDDDIDDEEDD
mgnify:FL=1